MKDKLLLDVDGTVAITAGTMLKYLIADGKLSPDTKITDVKWHYMEYNAEKGTGFPTVTSADTKKLYVNPDFWEAIPIYRNIKPIVNAISEKYEIHVVTARSEYEALIPETEDWFKKRGLSYHSIAMSKSINKHLYVKEHNIKFAIEDFGFVAKSIAPYCEKVFVVARPWNEKDILPSNCIRATWQKIGEYLL